MKVSEIITQLQAVLPKYCADFSESVVVSSLTRSGAVATAVCAAAHGLSTNDYAVIKGAYSPNTISSLTVAGTVATAVCASIHDLTYEEGATVLISGATQAGYNGVKTLLSVVNEYTFTFTVAAGTTTPATGTPILNEPKATGYNGRVKITKVDATTFTYTVSSGIPAAATGTITAMTGTRITGAITMDWLGRLYTEQAPAKMWMFVLPGDATASHNRQIQNDATYRYSPGQDYLQEIIQRPKVVIIAPTKDELAARAAVDHTEDLRSYIFKALLGVKFTSQLFNASQYGLTFISDRVADFNGAYYAHEFNFEMPSQIDQNDICNADDSVAWRTFEISSQDSEGTEMQEVAGKLP